MLHGLRVDGSMREENHTVVVTSQTLYDTHRINQLAKRAPHMGTGIYRRSRVQRAARSRGTKKQYRWLCSLYTLSLDIISWNQRAAKWVNDRS